MSAEDQVLEIRNISKSFPGTDALQDVTLSLRRGEIHAIVGENGAGKTTLMLILAGLLRADRGQIIQEGEPVEIRDVNSATSRGIALVPQEVLHFPNLSIAENIFVGRHPTRFWEWIDQRSLESESLQLLRLFDLNIDPSRKLGPFPLATAQMVSILSALSRQLRVLILDEPTSALTEEEVQRLFRALRVLKDQGVSVIFVSHKLPEVFKIADRISVLRDGRLIITAETKGTTSEEIVEAMVGRRLRNAYTSERSGQRAKEQPVALEVKNLCGQGFSGISFKIRDGEIVSFAGLAGDGRIEIAKTITGLLQPYSGDIYLRGKKIHFDSLADAIGHGVAYIPEDRKKEGLFLDKSVVFNAVGVNTPDFGGLGLVDQGHDRQVADWVVRTLSVRMPSIRAKARNLSGGNQQKLLLGKWLATKPRFVIACEPTRGVDVGAKNDIHHMLKELASQGVPILIVSSDLLELIALGDRVLVAHEGELVADLPNQNLTEGLIMAYASGSKIGEGTEAPATAPD